MLAENFSKQIALRALSSWFASEYDFSLKCGCEKWCWIGVGVNIFLAI